MTDMKPLLQLLRRMFCRHLFVDYYGRFDGEAVCIDCGKRRVFDDAYRS